MKMKWKSDLASFQKRKFIIEKHTFVLYNDSSVVFS